MRANHSICIAHVGHRINFEMFTQKAFLLPCALNV
jgi:hypothetical protein